MLKLVAYFPLLFMPNGKAKARRTAHCDKRTSAPQLDARYGAALSFLLGPMLITDRPVAVGISRPVKPQS